MPGLFPPRNRTFSVSRAPSGSRLLRGVLPAILVALGAWSVRAADPVPRVDLDYPDAAVSLYTWLDPGMPLAEPRVRIGLTTDRTKVALSATGAFRLLHPDTGRPIWRDPFRGTVVVVPRDEPMREMPRIFSVQMASFTERDAAERLADEWRQRLGREVRVVYHPDRRTWRVRAGRADQRSDLEDLVQRLRKEGFDEVWISEEPAVRRQGGALRLVDERYEDHPIDADRLVVVPAGGVLLQVEGKRYRGLLEVRLDPYGGIRVINELPIEAYLRGVVPGEMGPAIWPEVEALKAQAVAARTYTLGSLGQFSEEGYDLCDTPRCQVYGGVEAEHTLTDRAVGETNGQVLSWENQPIRALYSSTCGGHTEDGALIFENEKGPYLRGVPCLPEREVLDRSTAALAGRAPGAPGTAEAGDPSPLALGRLVVRGVIPREALDGVWRAEPAGPEEMRTWILALARVLGKTAPDASLDPPATLGAMTRALYRTLDWDRRARGRFTEDDPDFALRVGDAMPPGPEERRLWAFLVGTGVLVPFDDGTVRPDHRPSRGLVLGILGRTLDLYAEGEDERVSFRALGGRSLTVVARRREKTLTLASEPLLFAEDGGGTRQLAVLHLIPGDRLRIHLDASGRIDLLVAEERKGPTDDRYSVKYRWKVSYTAAELEKQVGSRIPAGSLRDLEVVRRGRSGRAVELKLRGSRGTFTVRGFRIRSVLGLEDTLFTIDLQRNPNGSLRRATFTGRGWGHGVGMCQVGAYGMALRGKDAREILSHYYTGAELVRAY